MKKAEVVKTTTRPWKRQIREFECSREEALTALAQDLSEQLEKAQIQYQIVNSWSVDTRVGERK